MKFRVLSLSLAALFLASCSAPVPVTPTPTPVDSKYKLTLDSPDLSKPLSSPLTIHGKVTGLYFFEATFPVELKDAQGHVLAQAGAHADSDWMTENQVPFTVNLTYSVPASTPATLVFSKDNPSGLPENDFSQTFQVNLQ